MNESEENGDEVEPRKRARTDAEQKDIRDDTTVETSQQAKHQIEGRLEPPNKFAKLDLVHNRSGQPEGT